MFLKYSSALSRFNERRVKLNNHSSFINAPIYNYTYLLYCIIDICGVVGEILIARVGIAPFYIL